VKFWKKKLLLLSLDFKKFSQAEQLFINVCSVKLRENILIVSDVVKTLQVQGRGDINLYWPNGSLMPLNVTLYGRKGKGCTTLCKNGHLK
jgi:hypothetical protein